MEQRLVLKHLNGRRKNKIDRLALRPGGEIVFGRGPECDVRYEEADDLVSRKHLKILATHEKPPHFTLIDLGSRNGTFVDHQRVFGSVRLLPGARVQLGVGGPEFQIAPQSGFAGRSGDANGAAAKWALGRRTLWLAKRIAAVLLIGAAGGGTYAGWTRTEPHIRNWVRPWVEKLGVARPKAPPVLASLATVDAEWGLVERTNVRLARAQIANERVSQDGRVPLLEGGPKTLTVFVLTEQQKIEPLLVPAEAPGAGSAIGGKWTATGVILAESRSVVTTAPDQVSLLDLPLTNEEHAVGALMVLRSGRVEQVVPLAKTQFPRWSAAGSVYLAEAVPSGLHEELRGRSISVADLRLSVTADLTAAGRRVRKTLSAASPPLWTAELPREMPFSGVDVAPADETLAGGSKHRVWVAGETMRPAKIGTMRADGRLLIAGADCKPGDVVFDQDGRVLAICVYDPANGSNECFAVPIRLKR